jgi:Polyketide cyclase / dehydrase and lipid transport
MTGQHATLFVPAAPTALRSILLQPLRIPDWNPAFLRLTGPETATVGVGYPITVRGGLRGAFEYSDIAERRIGWTWEVPGLHEVGAWRLTPQAGGTLVYHEFAHQGPLARVLRSAFGGVVHLRLDRLADQARTTPFDPATSTGRP